MLKVIEDPVLKKVSTIRHGFFTRQGGVSEGIYSSLNVLTKSLDNPAHVQENKRRIAAYFGYPVESLMTVKNCHGNKVVVVEKIWPDAERLEADGMVTQQRGIILGSTSADCPTVLLADEVAQIIGVAHAGWRGARGGILEAVIQTMVQQGADLSRLIATVSPCIHQKSYEVNDEFYQTFLNDNSHYGCYFVESMRPFHFQFNLLQYVKDRLLRLGIKIVSLAVAFDTYSDEKNFFSYRRATHRQERDFGGQLSCMVLI